MGIWRDRSGNHCVCQVGKGIRTAELLFVRRRRIAIVTTHPVQYYAPWFRHIAARSEIELKVFYLWNPKTTTLHDPGFGRDVQWDIPLLDGYTHEFVSNISSHPGSARFSGIDNPQLLHRLNSFGPDAALLIGYRYKSMLRLIFSRGRKFSIMLRGDSHRLGKVESGKWKVEIRKWGISRIFTRFSALLYVGRANYEYFRQHGVSEKKLFFAPHAVDNERFWLTEDTTAAGRAWRRELGIAEDNLLLMFAGKFEEKKCPFDLLQAFQRLQVPHTALLFVGSGKLESPLREKAAGTSNVFFAPFQNQSLMPRTYAAADLFVLPSYGSEETWGLAINEALCAAKPVIVSSHVGCGPDLVKAGKNGWIFKAGDVDQLRDVLREALSDRDRLIRWGEAGRQIVSEYNYARATEGLCKALESIVPPAAT